MEDEDPNDLPYEFPLEEVRNLEVLSAEEERFTIGSLVDGKR
jgi:hypothetical protein